LFKIKRSILSNHYYSLKEEVMTADISEPEIRFADITNSKIAYKTFGSGYPIVMCIGFAMNMDMWGTKLLEELQQQYQVIVFDYRGMGFSTNSEPSFTIGRLAEDIFELLTVIKIEKAHILGWSMGGFVAQMFAVNHPDMVNKLVLYATNCGDSETIDPTKEIVAILSNPSATPAEQLSLLFTDEWLLSHPQPWRYLPQPQEPFNPATIGLQYHAVQFWLSPGGGSFKHLCKLSMPVLLVSGEQDKVVPIENTLLISGEIKSSKIVKIADSGHGAMYQLPEEFSNAILTFLNG
jgi:pimeloyl-ACP methyl ester carboxylesterase